MTTINIQARNNADARRMGSREIRIPGANSQRHTGRKNVVVTTRNLATVVAWLDEAWEVDDYEIENNE
jgi:hypothetical protein